MAKRKLKKAPALLIGLVLLLAVVGGAAAYLLPGTAHLAQPVTAAWQWPAGWRKTE